MRLRKCVNGHYYDGSKYSKCPDCIQYAPQFIECEKGHSYDPSKFDECPICKVEKSTREKERPADDPLNGLIKCKNGHFFDNGMFNRCPYCKDGDADELKSEIETLKEQVELLKSQKNEAEERAEDNLNKVKKLTRTLKDEVSKNELLRQEIEELRSHIQEEKTGAEDNFDPDRTIIQSVISESKTLGWLAVKTPQMRGRIFVLKKAMSSIGRGAPGYEAVDVDIKWDRNISRGTQAVICYNRTKKTFTLEKKGKSTVYHNDIPTQTLLNLAPYDCIRLGETEMIFVPLCGDNFSW